MSLRRHRWLIALAVTAGIAAPYIAPAQAAAPLPDVPFAVARAQGERMLRMLVEHYGVVRDSLWRRDVDMVIRRLVRATGVPNFDVEWQIVGDPEMNASAMPGHVLVVNAGLLAAVDTIVRREVPNDPVRRRARRQAYVAAVLGHEIAHATLGHPDSTLREALAGRQGFDIDQVPEQVLAENAERLLADATVMRDLERSRAHESAADRAGALYLLRAGWTIQTAMDFFGVLDSLERAARHEAGPATTHEIRWFLSHPHSARRAADLEMLRARLRGDQATFDDALTLVQTGKALDSAVVMLDSVLVDFPELPQVHHARAVALERMWSDGASVAALRVRAAFPTYDTPFIQSVRGSVGDERLLERARAAYHEVLVRARLPYALANLAVLDAYAGDVPLALARSDSARRLAPNDTSVAVNRAVVLYLAGEPAQARALLAPIARGDSSAEAVYDFARASLAAGDTAAARAAFLHYRALDPRSSWGRAAGDALALTATAARRTDATAASNSAAPPMVMGITLGTRHDGVLAALGSPDASGRGNGALVLHYESRGLAVALGPDGSVVAIGVRAPATVAFDGVTVGMPLAQVAARLGAPVGRSGDAFVFDRGRWLLFVTPAGGLVESLVMATR
ncbi:peptidase M48 Ste24p (plasmid) [Gemmatirosa kalamazoonensis]|uniref:Peptidase M48 Ste24p n=1 Tax=Gemmatirosa kalamazoonensis TaxID=861299 RepID=W0RRL1_9BACT|nr:M48 family metallopeptidase [Gemmatirosa kalamazoonensis]AHG93331.1 peptidase M48 Ste24p [Gemmatirosa kalamazoonensis]